MSAKQASAATATTTATKSAATATKGATKPTTTAAKAAKRATKPTAKAPAAAQHVTVYDKAGKRSGEVALPAVFLTPVRSDLVRKAVRVSRANRRQRYGASPVAGERHSTESIGKGRGMSRVPRLKQGSNAALAPNNVGGRRAHPPESRTFWNLRIPAKERRLAIASALAATADGATVAARGHKVEAVAAFPVIVEDDFASTAETKSVASAFAAIGLDADLTRAKDGRHVRAGKGKLRGRRYKQPKSLLFVTADGTAPAVANLAGVDVVRASDLGAEHLAPGGDLGRLTVYTKGAIAAIQEAYS